MFRFAFFVCTCCAILMGVGLVPKPSVGDFPEFTVPEISLPEQPALLAEIGALAVDLPVLAKRIAEPVMRPSETTVRPVSAAPQMPVVSENTDVAVPVTLAETVTFDLDQAALDDQAKAQLNDIAIWLESNPHPEIHIFGHTDLTGSEVYNDALGQNRADQVASYLIANGVAPERISIVMSYGEAKPLVATEETSRANRRVRIETAFRS